MCQAAQNSALTFETLLAAFPHQRDIENLHRYAPLKSSVASFGQPDGAHSSMADLRNQGVDAENLTCQTRAPRQFQSARLEKALLRQCAVLAKQYFQLIGQSRVLALEGGQPSRALIVRHLERFVEVRTKSLPLIGA